VLGSCLATACTVCGKLMVYTWQSGSRESGTLGGTLPGKMICFLTPRCKLEEEVTYCLDYDEFISEYKGVSLVVHFAVQDFYGRRILLGLLLVIYELQIVYTACLRVFCASSARSLRCDVRKCDPYLKSKQCESTSETPFVLRRVKTYLKYISEDKFKSKRHSHTRAYVHLSSEGSKPI